MLSIGQLPKTNLPQNRNEAETASPRHRKIPNYQIVLGRLSQVFTLFNEKLHAVVLGRLSQVFTLFNENFTPLFWVVFHKFSLCSMKNFTPCPKNRFFFSALGELGELILKRKLMLYRGGYSHARWREKTRERRTENKTSRKSIFEKKQLPFN